MKKNISFKNLTKFYFSSEIILVISTILSLIIANSFLYSEFQFFLNKEIVSNVSLKFIIDDFLMAIFFFLVGLELKKEIILGELSNFNKAITPIIAAFGGVIVPAIIFLLFNLNDKNNFKAFAIPCATDIAFAYAVVKSFGSKISQFSRVFIVSLAVIDDLIAVVIIALFYTKNFNITYLFAILFVVMLLFLINKAKTNILSCNIFLWFVLWVILLRSSIHPAISGIIIAIFIPIKIKDKNYLENISHKISPLVNLFIIPAFVFANSMVSIDNFSFSVFSNPLFLGIFFGLFIGKQLGIMIFCWPIYRFKNLNFNKNIYNDIYSVAIFAGIGFTMSLFITNLSLSDQGDINIAKIAILLGSLASFMYGSFIVILKNKFLLTNRNL